MRISVRTIVAALGLAVLATGSVTALTSDPANAGVPCGLPDEGSPALRIGVPGKDIDGKQDAGALELRSENGERLLLTAPNPQPGERFGSTAYATTIENSDGETQGYLLVSAPGRTVDGKPNAGALHVFLCTYDGPLYVDSLSQAHPDVPGEPRAGAEFGAGLTAIRNPIEYVTHIVVGVPGTDVGTAEDAGGVVELDVRRGHGWTVDEWNIGGTTRTFDSPGVPGTARANDRLGETLGSYYTQWIAGAPNATVAGQPGAGAVLCGYVDDEHPSVLFHQATKGMPGTPEVGDHFGAAFDASNSSALWIGVPGEDIGDITDAGMVQDMNHGGGEYDTWEPGNAFSQDSPDDGNYEGPTTPVRGTAEPGDRFGASVGGYGQGRVLVGTPGEDIRTVRDAGMVTGLVGAPSLSRGSTPGYVAPRERFGAALFTDFNKNTMIGIPGARDGAGSLLYGNSPAVAEWVPWRLPSSDQPAAGDGYGTVFGPQED